MNQKESESARAPRASLSSEDIYSQVKRMATRYEFRPNERINEIELSNRLNVSRTPLREVLNQLLVEGFLTRSHNKGFICRPLDAQQIFDLYEFRRGLECAVAALACERATDAEIDALDAFARQSMDMSENEDAETLCQLDEEFHVRIARLARNEEFVRALENVNDRIHFVRWIRMQQGLRPVTEAEHSDIIAALRRRDAAAVAQGMDSHIGRRMDQIVEAVKAGFAEIYTRTDPSQLGLSRAQ